MELRELAPALLQHRGPAAMQAVQTQASTVTFALIVAVPVLYASTEDSGRSNRLILLCGLAWVALVLVNWGISFLVV
jgi:photosystem II PsbZ protein